MVDDNKEIVFWSTTLSLLARLDGLAVQIFVGVASHEIKNSLEIFEEDRSYVPRPIRDGLLKLCGLVDIMLQENIRKEKDLVEGKMKTLECVRVSERKILAALGRLALRIIKKKVDSSSVSWSFLCKFWCFQDGQLKLLDKYYNELKKKGARSIWVDHSKPVAIVCCDNPDLFQISSDLKNVVSLQKSYL